MGVDPRPLTLRQLARMADGRGRHDWAQAAAIIAMVANTARDGKEKPTPWTADDFNPYVERDRKRQSQAEDDVGVEPLKCFLTDKSRVRVIKVTAKVEANG